MTTNKNHNSPNVPNSIDKGNTIRNVPALRFPEFSGEWKREILNDVCTFHNGRAYKQNEFLSDGKYRVLRVGNFFTNDSWYYSDLELDDEKVAVNGDLLYAWSASFGPRFWTGEKVIYHYHIWKIDSFQQVSKEFLFYFLERDTEKIKNEVQGGTMVHITKGDMEKREILYPSILEQSKIARLLSLLDERIATQNKIIEDLKKLKSAISDLLFHSIADARTIRLGDIAHITNGVGDVQDANTEHQKDWYPFFDRSEELKWFPTYSFDKEAVIYAGEGQSFYPRYYNGKFALHQRCYAIMDFSSCILPKYCYHFMNTLNSYFVRNSVGSTVSSLRMDIFQKAEIKLPPIPKQQHICKIIDAFCTKLEVEQSVSSTLQELKQYLLSQMFI